MSANAGVCTACKRREAFFFRPYSGERLCRKCFAESIEAKVRASIAKYGMFKFDERIAVAVSGGKDSISLLHVLASMERLHPKASLVAVTVDEGIKGYRDEALEIASANCKKLEVDHHVVSFKELFGLTMDEIVVRTRLKSDSELTPCAYCGVLRRRALNVAARAVGASKIATAHTLDDEVQTILMNIFHGDVSRLAKEKPVTDDVHPRFVQKVKFQGTPCPYASEALRNDIRVMVNRMEEKHAGTKFTVFRSMERVRPALYGIAEKDNFEECVECGEPSSGGLCKVCQMLRQVG